MSEPIAVIEKNRAEELRICLDKFKGHDLVSVRVWCDAYSGTAKVATKKGVALAVDRLPELIAALQQAESEARRRGLLAAEDRAVAAE